MRKLFFICAANLCLGLVVSAPSFITSHESSDSFELPYGEKEGLVQREQTDPIIYEFHINSNISNRFVKTLVTSKVRNVHNESKETTFTVVLPDKAFISGFIMEIEGKQYTAYVKEKEEAKDIYVKAVSRGQSAGHVAVSARNSNRFTININVKAQSKATFFLTYEEMLERKNNQYELILNVHPGQVVKHLDIKVFVNESRPLKFVRTPSLRSGNEISKNKEGLDPTTNIQIINSTSATVDFKPDADKQKEYAKGLGGKEDDGLSGQFVVQYDVERDPQKGEILVKDGYFVHFFAPEDYEPLKKHVVFILDTSGSMWGVKLRQLKEAMVSILDELKEGDTFHIVEFNSLVHVWNIDSQERKLVEISNERDPFEELSILELPSAIPVTNETIQKGKTVIQKLKDEGLTNILSSLEIGLHLVSQNLKNSSNSQPIIIFLTDGDPTRGIQDTAEITKIITNINNQKDHVPIFSLSFGDGADKNFLKKLSLQNLGFTRHIYEAADAALQLQEFYSQISVPLLSNVRFEYTEVEEVSKQIFPIYFKGSELVVSGRYDEGFDASHWKVSCSGYKGQISIPAVIDRPVASLERLWAYLTIKQKLDEREISEHKSKLAKEALDIALKYSFVTDVSSLVVVTPNDTSSVDTEDASKPKFSQFKGTSSYRSAPMGPRLSQFSDQLIGPPGASGRRLVSNMGSRAFFRQDIQRAPQGLRGYPITNFLQEPLGYQQQNVIYGYGFAAAGTKPYKCSPTSICTTPFAFSAQDMDRMFAPTQSPILLLPTSSGKLILTSVHLKDTLPWLKDITSSNGTINVLGGEYELGENQHLDKFVECPKTPLNNTETGSCSLLSECRSMHSHLPDFNTYEKYACILEKKYAGICCPQIVPVP